MAEADLGDWLIVDLATGGTCLWPTGLSPYPFATENDAMTFCAHLNQGGKMNSSGALYVVMRAEDRDGGKHV